MMLLMMNIDADIDDDDDKMRWWMNGDSVADKISS